MYTPPHDDRYLSADPTQRALARRLYQQVAALPIVAPHGHVPPALFADPDYRFGSPVELLIQPDHYLLRMLYSHGVPLESLGIPRRDGAPVETDHRRIWQTFAGHFYRFRATPSGLWLRDQFETVFGITEKLTPQSAASIYDQIAARLAAPDFTPRRLYQAFNLDVLCTTDAATDPLTHHQAIRASGWPGDIRPTFRPDALFNLHHPGWRTELDRLSAVSGIDVSSYPRFIAALEQRRAFFKSLGATATDHGVETPSTAELSTVDSDAIFQRALAGHATAGDTQQFTAHLLIEMARMSVDDGLVMQLHAGSYRNHNPHLFDQFGPDIGADIPIATEFTRNLAPLLARFGNQPNFTLILFTLDESTYARELAPLAGHYPALKLGPPWWFHDSLNGMRRYFDQVVETAGIDNTAGFNDDTRAFLSIPARHALWRRAAANWLAGLVLRRFIDEDDAAEMIVDLAVNLARRAYHLPARP